MRARRRSSTETYPPAHIQLSTISLVEGAASSGMTGAPQPHALGACVMPAAAPERGLAAHLQSRDVIQGIQGIANSPGKRPISGSPQSQSRARSSWAPAPATAAACTHVLSPASQVPAGLESQHQAVRKVLRPSSGRNASSSMSHQHWSSAGMISKLLGGDTNNTLADSPRQAPDAGTPRSVSLRHRADLRSCDDMTLGSAMSRDIGSRGARRGEAQSVKRDGSYESVSPQSALRVQAIGQIPGEQRGAASWRSSSVTASHPIGQHAAVYNTLELDRSLDLERTRSSPQDGMMRQGVGGGQRRIAMALRPKPNPNCSPARGSPSHVKVQGAVSDEAHMSDPNGSIAAAKLMMVVRPCPRPSGAAQSDSCDACKSYTPSHPLRSLGALFAQRVSPSLPQPPALRSFQEARLPLPRTPRPPSISAWPHSPLLRSERTHRSCGNERLAIRAAESLSTAQAPLVGAIWARICGQASGEGMRWQTSTPAPTWRLTWTSRNRAWDFVGDLRGFLLRPCRSRLRI
jgi:hypothetical protein